MRRICTHSVHDFSTAKNQQQKHQKVTHAEKENIMHVYRQQNGFMFLGEQPGDPEQGPSPGPGSVPNGRTTDVHKM